MSTAIKRRLAALELTHQLELKDRKLSILATVLEVTTDKALIGTHSTANGYVSFYAETLKAAYALREQYLVDKKDVIVLCSPVLDADSRALQQVTLAKHDEPSPVLVDTAAMSDSELIGVWIDGVTDANQLELIDSFHDLHKKDAPEGAEYVGLVIQRDAHD